jgi:hypothetical protein
MAMSTEAINRLLQELHSLGELEVRRRIPSGIYGDEGSAMRFVVDEWLQSEASAREMAAQAGSEAREAEANLLARQANTLARIANKSAEEANSPASRANVLASRANWIAMIAMIISAATTIVVTIISSSKP